MASKKGSSLFVQWSAGPPGSAQQETVTSDILIWLLRDALANCFGSFVLLKYQNSTVEFFHGVVGVSRARADDDDNFGYHFFEP